MGLTNEKEVIQWMKLSQVPKLGPKKIQDLYANFGSMQSIFDSSDQELLNSRAFNESMLADWEKLKNAAEENFLKTINECRDNNISILTLVDEEYPQVLKRIPYPPKTLFLKGDHSLFDTQKIAIVGSREASPAANKWAYNLAKALAEIGETVVSGGAVGVDTAAHKGALDGHGKTICVLGSGFFKMFPEENLALFEEISKKGLLISEHLPNFPGSRIALIQRNRITSGISRALVMAASKATGGAMVQTKIAYEQRVKIFIPKIELRLQPNEGLIQIKNEWNGTEIDDAQDLLKNLESNSILRAKESQKLLPL